MLENVTEQLIIRGRSHKKMTEANKASAKAYRERNREAMLERTRLWREQNKEYIRASGRAKYNRFKEQWAKSSCDRHKADPRARLFRTAKARAKKYGVEFSIEFSDIVVPEFCPITKLKLAVAGGRFTAASPSLDRINNLLGYVPGNVRVISYKANSYKGNLTLEEIDRLHAYVHGKC